MEDLNFTSKVINKLQDPAERNAGNLLTVLTLYLIQRGRIRYDYYRNLFG